MKILIHLSLLLLLVANLYVSNTAEASEPETTSPENRIALHAPPGERLRLIMQNINLTIHDSTNIDSQSDRISKQDMDDMIEVVEELLFYAEMMSTDLPSSKMD